jgi:hypothetical protein
MTLSSLLLSFVFALPAHLVSDCPACKPDALCAPHRDAESKLLEQARPKLHGKDVAQKRDALTQIAALSKEHENAPGRAAADALAFGLKDDAFEIRAFAAQLLAKGQHPDAAVKALSAAVDDIRSEVAKLGKGDGARGGGATSITSDSGRNYVEAVAQGLAALPDDRGVDALGDLLRQLDPAAPDAVVTPVVRALGELKSRDAIRAIVQRFVNAEGTRQANPNNKNNGGGGAGGGGAGGAGGGGGVGGGGRGGFGGGGRGGGNNNGNGNGYRDHGASEEQRKALHEALHGAALDKRLNDAPDYSDKVAQAWKNWFEKHESSFPAKLGKLGGAPVDAPGAADKDAKGGAAKH